MAPELEMTTVILNQITTFRQDTLIQVQEARKQLDYIEKCLIAGRTPQMDLTPWLRLSRKVTRLMTIQALLTELTELQNERNR